MPSPLGHGLVALSLHALTAPDERAAHSLARAGVLVGAALAPDLDLLLRFVDGRNHHQGASHSIGCALLAGALAAAVARLARAPRPFAWGGLASLGWLSHVALDLLGRDTHPPIGLMALWPLTRGYYKVPWPLFMDIGRTLDWRTVRHDALAVAWEAVVLGALLALCWRARPARRRP